MLKPGTTETDIDKQIFKLTEEEYGTRKHWHQRLPRIGQNTVHPIYEKVPDLTLKEDDIAYVDLGPVFGTIEADFARTYVLGNDEEKHKLNAALSEVFKVCKQHYLANPSTTGADFFAFVRKTCTEAGYEYANPNYCAHLVGKWSHDQEFGDAPEHFACPACSTPMNAPGPDGQQRMWILEIHLLQDPSVGRVAKSQQHYKLPCEMVSKRERKPKVQWQEQDFHAPARTSRKTAHHVPAPRHKPPQGAPSEALVPQANLPAPGSPLSDDSAATSIHFAPRTSHQRSTAPATKERASKPLKPESPAWRIGVEDGLFPKTVLCNRHGALDGRDRLWRQVDAQGIWDLQSSDMPDEEKAALSVLCYQAPQDPKGKASSSSEDVEAAGGQGKAEAGQPWGAQSPTHHMAPAQAASAASEQQPVVSQAGVGDRKRKRASSKDGSHCEEGLHAPRSKRRQLFAEPSQGSGKSNSGSLLDNAVDLWLQQAGVDSWFDVLEEDDSAPELSETVSGHGVLCMHRASSSSHSEKQMG
ncbi:hypothetical protein ABBQ32_001577 [Trebouxia sp. C0010 RCD-2024]